MNKLIASVPTTRPPADMTAWTVLPPMPWETVEVWEPGCTGLVEIEVETLKPSDNVAGMYWRPVTPKQK